MADTTAESATTPGKRVRKQVELFQVTPVAQKKEFKATEGKGTKLVQYEHFVQELTKHKGDSELVKSLHNLMYNSLGKKSTAKHNLREFSGFPEEVSAIEKTDKLIENKKKWTVSILKDAMGLFGLEKGGNREDLCRRLVDYLSAPRIIVTAGKRPRSSMGKGSTKRARKADKKKRAPSAYILYSSAHRAETKAEHPEASATDMIKLLSEKWNAASAEVKEEWQQKANEAKAKLAEEQGHEEEVASSSENENEEDADEGAESDDAAESDQEEDQGKEKADDSNEEQQV